MTTKKNEDFESPTPDPRLVKKLVESLVAAAANSERKASGEDTMRIERFSGLGPNGPHRGFSRPSDIDLESSFNDEKNVSGKKYLIRNNKSAVEDPALWLAGLHAYKASLFVEPEHAQSLSKNDLLVWRVEYAHYFLSIELPELLKERMGDMYLKPVAPTGWEGTPLLRETYLYGATLTQFRDYLLHKLAFTDQTKWNYWDKCSRASAGLAVLQLINGALYLKPARDYGLYGLICWTVGGLQRFFASTDIVRSINTATSEAAVTIERKAIRDKRVPINTNNARGLRADLTQEDALKIWKEHSNGKSSTWVYDHKVRVDSEGNKVASKSTFERRLKSAGIEIKKSKRPL